MRRNPTPQIADRPPRLLAAALLALAGTAAYAQPDPGSAATDPEAPPAQAQPEPRDSTQMRRFIEDRLAETRRQEERLERALRLLDAGESRERIMELLPPRSDRGPGAGDLPRAGRARAERSTRPGGEGEPPMGEGRPPGSGRDGFVLSAEQREKVIAFLTEHLDDMPPRFREAWSQDDGAPARIAQRMGPRVLEVLSAERRDARLGELKRQEFRRGADLLEAMTRAREAFQTRQADPEQFDAALNELRRRFGEQFDLRARIHQREIELTAERLEQARADFEAMLSQRGGNVQSQLDRFVAELEDRQNRPPRSAEPGSGDPVRPPPHRKGDR